MNFSKSCRNQILYLNMIFDKVDKNVKAAKSFALHAKMFE